MLLLQFHTNVFQENYHKTFQLGVLQKQPLQVPSLQGPSRLDMEKREWKIGDLVWTRVQGYPWWPGQVTCPNWLIAMADRRVRSSWSCVEWMAQRCLLS